MKRLFVIAILAILVGVGVARADITTIGLTGDVTVNTSGVTAIKSSVSLTTPILGAATATSLLATGIVDGTAPVSVDTSTPVSVGATYLTGYHFNQHATPAQAMVYNLPVAAAGKQYVIKNSHGAGGANTGVLSVVPITGTTINYNGTNCTASYKLVSDAAAGNYIAIVGVTATNWEVVGSKGTWTCTAP